MTRLLLIRHGDTDFVGRGFAGWLPGVHLNDAGRNQAAALAHSLDEFPPQAIYSSPLERARETAEPIAQRYRLALQLCDGIGELQLGEWTGRSFESLRDDPQFQRFNAFRGGTRIPGGEMMIEVQARVVAALERMRRDHAAQCVAVVSHSDVIKAALLHMLGMSLELWARIEVDPASLSIVDYALDHVRVVCVNARRGG